MSLVLSFEVDDDRAAVSLEVVDDEPMKLCLVCKEYWPHTIEYFHRRRRPDGTWLLYSPCKACIDEARRRKASTTPCCYPGCTNPRYEWRQARCYEHRYHVMKKKEQANG